MNIHEYQAKALLRSYGSPVSDGRVVLRSEEAKTAAGELDGRPIGYAVNKPNFELAAKYAWQQRTIPRELKVDELFDATTRSLGA